MSIRIGSVLGLLLLAGCQTGGSAPGAGPILPLPAAPGVPVVRDPPTGSGAPSLAPAAPASAAAEPRSRGARVESLVPRLATIPIVDIAPIQDALSASAPEAQAQQAEAAAPPPAADATSGGLF